MMNVQIHCPHDEMVEVSKLKPHPKNRNSHPEDQIERLAKILEYQGFRYPIKVSKLSGFITAGHGRVLAAQKLNLEKVPVSFQEYKDDAQEYADIIADNAVAAWSELDLSGINSDLPEFGPELDIEMLGIKDFNIDADHSGLDDPTYTDKITAPIYEPKGEMPTPKELYDKTKSLELLDEIKNAELSDDVREFLEFSANRHIVFNYQKIAEFYAHADPALQSLMEKSALVIIDFNKAIENGFVQMTKEISELSDE